METRSSVYTGGHTHPHAQEHTLIMFVVPTVALFLSFACDFSNTVIVVKSAFSGKASKRVPAFRPTHASCSLKLGGRVPNMHPAKEQWVRFRRSFFMFSFHRAAKHMD